MSKTLDQLNKLLQGFDDSPLGYGADLRMDLAELIWKGLKRKGWSQRDLAKRSGLADAVISNLVHGNNNCTLDTAGTVMHVLDIRATIAEHPYVSNEISETPGIAFRAIPTGINLGDLSYGENPATSYFFETEGNFAGQAWEDHPSQSGSQRTRIYRDESHLDRSHAAFAEGRFRGGNDSIFRFRSTGQHGRDFTLHDTDWPLKADG